MQSNSKGKFALKTITLNCDLRVLYQTVHSILINNGYQARYIRPPFLLVADRRSREKCLYEKTNLLIIYLENLQEDLVLVTVELFENNFFLAQNMLSAEVECDFILRQIRDSV